MSDIKISDQHIEGRDYSTYSSDTVVQKHQIQKTSEEEQVSTTTSDLDVSVEELLAKNPKLKTAYDKLAALASDPDIGDDEIFNVQKLILSLINLAEALKGAATAYADRLAKITEKLNAYAKLMNQIPVVLENDVYQPGTWIDSGSLLDGVFIVDEEAKKKRSDEEKRTLSENRATLNQKYGNMLEGARANKDIEQDKAKKIQTIMQTLKDADQSAHDFIGAFIDLFRGISQKIMR